MSGNRIARIVMGVIAIGVALAFFAVPVFKVRDLAMGLIILIGVVAMVYSFIETMGEKDDD